MEELKLLLELVANLPAMAMWVLIGLFAYKVVIVGSIYGVIRLGITKTHDWLTRDKQWRIAGKPISAEVAAALQEQIERIAGSGPYSYIRSSQVEQLRKAIDAMGGTK
jgi:hypothetical protein